MHTSTARVMSNDAGEQAFLFLCVCARACAHACSASVTMFSWSYTLIDMTPCKECTQ